MPNDTSAPEAISWPAITQLHALPAPMLALVRFIAGSPHASGLYPAVAGSSLWIGRTPDVARGQGVLQIGLDAATQEWTFTYVAGSGDQRGWSRTCTADELIATFERILHKRLRWLHEG